MNTVSESLHAPCVSAMQTGLYSHRLRSHSLEHGTLHGDLVAHLKLSVSHAGPRIRSMRGARWTGCPLMGAVGRSTMPQRCCHLALPLVLPLVSVMSVSARLLMILKVRDPSRLPNHTCIECLNWCSVLSQKDLKFFNWKVPSDMYTPSPSRSRYEIISPGVA